MRRCPCRWRFHRSGFRGSSDDHRSCRSILVAALKACGSARETDLGKLIHGEIEEEAALDLTLSNTLISLYAKCGRMADARRVFDGIPSPDVISWNVLVLGYAENDQEELALELVETMHRPGSDATAARPNARTSLAAVKACISLAAKEQGQIVNGKLVKLRALQKGSLIHSRAVIDPFVANSLVDMYAKCGSMMDARQSFDKIPSHSVVSWTCLMLGYVHNGDGESALEIFQRIIDLDNDDDGTLSGADASVFVAALKACSIIAVRESARQIDGTLVKSSAMDRGMLVHAKAAKYGLDRDICVASTLVNMYAKCGSMDKACKIFNSMPRHDTVAWTAMMIGYAEHGDGDLVLELFDRMKSQGCVPDSFAFVAALNGCICLAERETGAAIGGKIVKVRILERGMAVHCQAKRLKCDTNSFVANSLIDMYVKCGSILDARGIFDRMLQHTVVSWNALMAGYVENRDLEMVLELFEGMQLEGFSPDALTYVAVLKACIGLTEREARIDGIRVESLERSMDLHSRAIRSDLDADMFVAGSLIELYARCGSAVDARRVFDRLPRHDVVSWTALILGYADAGEGHLALDLFRSMRASGCVPDGQTFLAAIKALGSSITLASVKSIHVDKVRAGFENDQFLETSLLDAYGKCGSMIEAHQLFDSLPRLDTPTWTSLIAGYSRRGDSAKVVEVFDTMHQQGFQADEVTFVCLLSACSHAGFVEKGKKFFELMTSRYRIRPTLEHYVCMVDIYGRANQLDSALEMLRKMPFEANVVAWRTLLAACAKWNNAIVGKVAFDYLVKLDRASAAAYSLMGNIYGSDTARVGTRA